MQPISLIMGLSVAILMVGSASSARFDELYQPNWAMDHFLYEGELLKMKLDNHSGAGFSSKSKYMYGKVTVQIKLVEGDSAGTVTAFYMSSDGPNHNEFDFEFLGNSSGEPYLVQTNLYVNGVGNREQRHNLWFDPTIDFHSYSIFWNQHQVLKSDLTGVCVFVLERLYRGRMCLGAVKGTTLSQHDFIEVEYDCSTFKMSNVLNRAQQYECRTSLWCPSTIRVSNLAVVPIK